MHRRMRLLSLGLLNKHSQVDRAPTILCQAIDVAHLSWFYREKAKEFLRFAARELVRTHNRGERAVATEGEYRVHVSIMPHGLAAVAVTDMEYPERVVFTMLRTLLNDFELKHSSACWSSLQKDNHLNVQDCKKLMSKYQDPAVGDKLTAIQKDLDETMVIMHENINEAIGRGVQLEELLERSVDLSKASKHFYKTARKQNACC